MRTSNRSESIPLTGADCFLRAFDVELSRRCGASHLSQLVLRLGPGFQVDRLRKALETLVLNNPILRAPIRRRRVLGAPIYLTGRSPSCAMPAITLHDGAAERTPAVPEIFLRRLNDRFDSRQGELLRIDVVPYRGGSAGTDVAFTWVHMLFDGFGSERFVRWLDECDRGVAPPDAYPADRSSEPRGMPTGGRERGRMATSWQAHMKGLAVRPPRSLAGPLRRVRQDLTYTVTTFSPEETKQIAEASQERAGFLTPMLYYLATSIRAHHAIHRERGSDPGSYVVPLPVNLRAKGDESDVFRSRVSMIWFQVTPEKVEDLNTLLAELKLLRRRAIREKQIENGVAAMDYARHAPARLYSHMARRNFRGELCSFFFAFTDEFLPRLEGFLGSSIENGFHAPSVPPSPGSSAVFSIFRGRLNLTHVHQRGALDDRELRLFRDQLRRDLLGENG